MFPDDPSFSRFARNSSSNSSSGAIPCSIAVDDPTGPRPTGGGTLGLASSKQLGLVLRIWSSIFGRDLGGAAEVLAAKESRHAVAEVLETRENSPEAGVAKGIASFFLLPALLSLSPHSYHCTPVTVPYSCQSPHSCHRTHSCHPAMSCSPGVSPGFPSFTASTAS